MNKYRFNSNLLWEQLVRRTQVDIVVSGNVPAGAELVWSSGWFSMAIEGATIRAEASVPGSLAIPAVSNAKFQVPDSLIYEPTFFLDFIVEIETSGPRYRAAVRVSNPYNFVVASPNRTISFTMKEYLPPRA